MSALHSNTTGYYNTASGMEAGRYISGGAANTTSNNSLYLGYDTKALASGDTNEIVIGASAVGVGSNSAVLGNNSITKTILKGSVGIGTTSPGQKLTVAGTIESTSGGIKFPDGTIQTSAGSLQCTIVMSGWANKSTNATCPAGYLVTGGGLTGACENPDSYPCTSTQWCGSCVYGDDWLYVYAVCCK
ncbi:MAG: hypothetical protein KJ842_04895, partial [Candidatus Omnitrophica bacterium]|nr:hypothetical protein [Candidatus Omnitrophota bacterium]